MCRLCASIKLVGTFVCVFAQGCAASYGSARSPGSPSVADNLGQIPAEISAVRPSEPAPHLDGATLDRRVYVRAVLTRNPTLESARQGYRAALARAQGAGTFDDPMLEVGVAPLSIASRSAPLGYELSVSQRLPWFGKRSLEASAGAAEADASKSDLQTTKQDLALAAVLLYDEYFVAERSLEINARHVELMGLLRDAATAQFQAGRGSAQDSLQAESELAHMDHDRARLVTERAVTVAQMNELLHRAPDLPLPPPARELAVSDPENAADAQRASANAAANRSEISAALRRSQAAQARAARAERDVYPDLTVSTSYNSMWDTPAHRWMVGVGLSLPIQSGRRSAAADEARAMSAQFQSDATRLSDSARTQSFVARARLEEAEHVVSLFEERLLPIAKQQIEAARAGFVSAQSSFTSLVEAEKNLRSAELEYQIARAECDRQHAELDRALGRTPGLAAESETP